MLRIFSWNVNGLRAVINKGALEKFLDEKKPDILCMQEIKARPDQVLYDFDGYEEFWNPAERPGYSGTAILVSEVLNFRFGIPECIFLPSPRKLPEGQSFPDDQRMTFWDSKSTEETNIAVPNNKSAEENNIAVSEGRVVVLDCEKFFLVNVYTPNSKPDLSRLELREKFWDPEFLNLLKELEKTKPVVACGDFNAAHEEIDLARPKTNHHSAGFTDEERQGITNLINAGFVDTFRELNPDTARYTWWSHWGHARENNVGWRIDYFFISQSLLSKLKGAEIYEGVMGSDHCPISIDLEV